MGQELLERLRKTAAAAETSLPVFQTSEVGPGAKIRSRHRRTSYQRVAAIIESRRDTCPECGRAGTKELYTCPECGAGLPAAL